MTVEAQKFQTQRGIITHSEEWIKSKSFHNFNFRFESGLLSTPKNY